MRRVAKIGLWWVLRGFGLYSLTLGMAYATMTLHLENNYIPYAERAPYMATCLAFFGGTLVLIPSTTPLWIREVKDVFSALVTIVSLAGLTAAIFFGLYRMLPIAMPDITNVFNTVFAAAALFLLVLGTWCAAVLGLTGGQERARPRVLMSATAPGDEFDPRMRR